MPRITLVGPGAIGGLAAAWLCRDERNDVTVCARTPLEALRLESPHGSFTARPRIRLNPDAAAEYGEADWILVATKAYDSARAARWFEGALGERTRVAVLQNGVDHVERFSAYLPASRIVPVIVDCPTERVPPGTIRQRGEATMAVPDTAAGAEFCALFERTRIRATPNPEFLSVAWRKLCINAAGVVNALTGQPAGVANDPNAAALMRHIVQETAAVGRAEGARLAEDIADEVVGIYRGQPADSVNSLLADRLAGRPMETDIRNGVIVRLGKKHGIATPYNEMAVALLSVKTPL